MPPYRVEAGLKGLFVGVLILAAAGAGWWLSEPPEAEPRGAARDAAPGPASAAPVAPPEQAAAPASDGIPIRTRRYGPHHVVDAELSGPGGIPVSVELVVDTGASMLVLPASLIEELGFDESQLSRGRAQTARGVVQTRNARLDRVEIGGDGLRAAADDVEVAFVRDALLGDNALLGMSFLGRFRLMIDDRHDEIVLFERP